jgi:hypothetical protein
MQQTSNLSIVGSSPTGSAKDQITNNSNRECFWLSDFFYFHQERENTMHPFVKAAEEFYSHGVKLLVEWEKLNRTDEEQVCHRYPFDSSFDEKLADFSTWLEYLNMYFTPGGKNYGK